VPAPRRRVSLLGLALGRGLGLLLPGGLDLGDRVRLGPQRGPLVGDAGPAGIRGAVGVRDLERIVVDLGRMVLDQGQEITRLRQELDHELTSKAIQSLRPWPTTHVVTLDALLNSRPS
jgi:hypothetical protein